jgi:transcriptional regulatory protein RtcR
MATLSESGLITDSLVDDEIARLTRLWRHGHAPVAGDKLASVLGEEGAAQLDRFDAIQLQEVIAVCRTARSLSDAGRLLFAVSRAAKAKPNDADRLKKYLARFDLDWDQVSNKRFTPRTSRPSAA